MFLKGISATPLPPSSDSPEPSLFPLEVTNVTTAVDIYSFGMCALEVRKPQAVVTERGQIRRQKGEMEGRQVRS